MFTLTDLEAAAAVVYRAMAPTTQQRWPLLDERCGTSVWVKHENHTPVGAFKVRGGLVYFDDLSRSNREVKGVVAATRGNHGQSVAFAARSRGIPVAVVVPHGNSVSKNRAMCALGAELIERGHDFQASLDAAARDRGRARLASHAVVSRASGPRRGLVLARVLPLRYPISTRSTFRSASDPESAVRWPHARRWVGRQRSSAWCRRALQLTLDHSSWGIRFHTR